MEIIIAIMFGLAVLGLPLLGWIVPLVIGIRRSSQDRGGRVLIIIGSVWGIFGLVGLGMTIFLVVVFSTVNAGMKVEPFDPKTCQGDTGTIMIDHIGSAELVLKNSSTGKKISLSSVTPSFVAPTGTFSVNSLTLFANDTDGDKWTARIRTQSGSAEQIVIEKGSAVTLSMGEPFEASIKPRKTSSGYSLDLKISDSAENRATISCSTYRKKPGFQGVDDRNQIVWSGNFEYG